MITQIISNNIKDSDASNIQSQHDSINMAETLNDVVKVSSHKKLNHALDFIITLWLWCGKENIKQQTCNSQREFLVLMDHL